MNTNNGQASNETPLNADQARRDAQHWRSKSGRRYPSWSEMLEIMRELGYGPKDGR